LKRWSGAQALLAPAAVVRVLGVVTDLESAQRVLELIGVQASSAWIQAAALTVAGRALVPL